MRPLGRGNWSLNATQHQPQYRVSNEYEVRFLRLRGVSEIRFPLVISSNLGLLVSLLSPAVSRYRRSQAFPVRISHIFHLWLVKTDRLTHATKIAEEFLEGYKRISITLVQLFTHLNLFQRIWILHDIYQLSRGDCAWITSVDSVETEPAGREFLRISDPGSDGCEITGIIFTWIRVIM